MKVIDLKKLNYEKKIVQAGVRYTPTFHKIIKEVARTKGVTMAKLIEDLVIKEYKKLLKEGRKNG